MDFDFTKLLNLFAPASKRLVETGVDALGSDDVVRLSPDLAKPDVQPPLDAREPQYVAGGIGDQPSRDYSKLVNLEAAPPETVNPIVPTGTAPTVDPVAPMSLNRSVYHAEQDYLDALNAPIEKQDKWKDVGSYILSGLAAVRNSLNGQPVQPITGYGRVKKDNLIRERAQKLAPLQQQQVFQSQIASQEAARENLERDNDARDAQQQFKRNLDDRNFLLRQLQTIKRYKRGENPAFDDRLDKANIEQPDFEPQRKIPPTFWDANGRKMTYDLQTGAAVPVLTPDGQEIIDLSRANTTYDGYVVKPNVALGNKTQREIGNASRQQQANIFNATKEFEARKINIENDQQYNNKLLDKAMEIAKLSGESEKFSGALAGLKSEYDAKLGEYNQIIPDETGNYTDDQIKRKNALLDDLNSLSAKIWAETGKSEAGRQAIKALEQTGIKRPEKIQPVKIQPVQVPTGQPKFTESEIRSRAKQRGMSDAQIEQKINEARANGWLIQ